MCRLIHSLKNYHNYFHDYRGYRNDRDHLDYHENLTAGLPNVQTYAFPEKYHNYDYRGYPNDRDHIYYQDNLTLACQKCRLMHSLKKIS